jgi:hypothetical protein
MIKKKFEDLLVGKVGKQKFLALMLEHVLIQETAVQLTS